MNEVIEIACCGGGRAENDNEDGDAKDGTDLATHLDDGAAGGGLICSKPGSTCRNESRNSETGADSDDEPSRQNGGSVVGMGTDAEADEYSSNTNQQCTNGRNDSSRYQRCVSPQSDRSHGHHGRPGSDTEAGLDGRPPPALLEPEHEAKELGAKGDRDKEHSHVGPREDRLAEQVKVDNRRRVPR